MKKLLELSVHHIGSKYEGCRDTVILYHVLTIAFLSTWKNVLYLF